MDISQPTRRGFPLWEAVMPLRLVVIGQDIACAVAGSPTECVLAQALKRMFGPDSYVEVFASVAYAFLGDHYERFTLPAATQRVIQAYDRTGEWTATDVLFSPPSPGRTLAARAEARRKGHGTRGPNATPMGSKRARVFMRGASGYLDSLSA